jgi:hypothetical protein
MTRTESLKQLADERLDPIARHSGAPPSHKSTPMLADFAQMAWIAR